LHSVQLMETKNRETFSQKWKLFPKWKIVWSLYVQYGVGLSIAISWENVCLTNKATNRATHFNSKCFLFTSSAIWELGVNEMFWSKEFYLSSRGTFTISVGHFSPNFMVTLNKLIKIWFSPHNSNKLHGTYFPWFVSPLWMNPWAWNDPELIDIDWLRVCLYNMAVYWNSLQNHDSQVHNFFSQSTLAYTPWIRNWCCIQHFYKSSRFPGNINIVRKCMSYLF